MKVELELKNGKCRRFRQSVAEVLVKKGLGKYLTRDMKAAESAPVVEPDPVADPEPVVDSDEESTDVETLRAELDARGIAYHHRAGVVKLRELLEG